MATTTNVYELKDGGKLTITVDGPPPVVVIPPDPIPVIKRLNAGISDASLPSKHASFFPEVNLNGIRIWLEVDAVTGDLSGKDDAARDAKIASINSYFNLGLAATVVLTPPNGAASVVHPAKAIARLIAKLDKRVVIALVNEPNTGTYWPGSDWVGAFRWADKVAGELRAAGFKTASPSFTGWVGSWVDWWKQIIKLGLHKNFDYVALHFYPHTDGCQLGKDAACWLNSLRKMAEAGKQIAALLTTTLGRPIVVYADEWGYGRNPPLAAVLAIHPTVQAILNEATWGSAYFIVSKTGKLPHDEYPRFIDFTTGERNEPLIAVFKANKST